MLSNNEPVYWLRKYTYVAQGITCILAKKMQVCCPRKNIYILARKMHVCCPSNDMYTGQERTCIMAKTIHVCFPRKNLYAAQE